MCSHDPRLIPPDPDDLTKGISAFVGWGFVIFFGGIGLFSLALVLFLLWRK